MPSWNGVSGGSAHPDHWGSGQNTKLTIHHLSHYIKQQIKLQDFILSQ